MEIQKKQTRKDLLQLCSIDYIAPGDASKTDLKNDSVHYHVSNAVYEHIPLNIINGILKEGNRIISKSGLFINIIDYGDHFSSMDKDISVINFLQYDDREWDIYAGKRYTYMNRARHDDFIELFKIVGHEFLEIETHVNKNALEILKKGEILLDKKFITKSNDILSITGAAFITKKIL